MCGVLRAAWFTWPDVHGPRSSPVSLSVRCCGQGKSASAAQIGAVVRVSQPLLC